MFRVRSSPIRLKANMPKDINLDVTFLTIPMKGLINKNRPPLRIIWPLLGQQQYIIYAMGNTKVFTGRELHVVHYDYPWQGHAHRNN